MSQEPKKMDRRTFIYAGLGAAIIIVGGAAVYFATKPAETVTSISTSTVPTTTTATTTATSTTTATTTQTSATTTTATATTTTATTITTSPLSASLAYLCEAGPEPELAAETFKWFVQEHPETKITFKPDIAPRDIARMKMMSEMTQKSSIYQLFFVWLGDTSLWLDKDMLAAMNDLLPADLITKIEANLPSFLLQSVQKNGKTYNLPIYWNSLSLFYRKDLFDNSTEKANFKAKYGYDLRPPRTFKEWVDAAEFFTRPPDLYGYSINGQGWAFFWDEYMTTSLACAGLYPHFDIEKETTNINSPAGVKVMETLAKLAKSSPPGWEDAEWFGTGDPMFAEGKLAMWGNWYYPWPMFQNPEKSKVVGKVGVAPWPTLDETIKTNTWLSGGGVAVNKWATETEKRAATEYLKWMESDPVQKKMALTGELFLYSRLDILKDPEVQAKLQPDPFTQLPNVQAFFSYTPEENAISALWTNESAEAHHRVAHGEMSAQAACDWLAQHLIKVIKDSKAQT